MIKNNYSLKKKILFIIFTLMFTGVFFALDTIQFSKNYNSEEKYVEESLFSNEEGVEKINYLEIAKDIIKEKSKEELLKEKIQKRKELIIKHIEDEKEIKKINKQQEELDREIELILKNDEIKNKNKLEKNNKKKNLILDNNNIPEIDFIFIPKIFGNNSNTGKKNIYKVINSEIIYSFIKELNVVFNKTRPDVRGRMKNKSVYLYAPQNMRKDELLAIFVHEFSHYIDIYFLNKSSGKDISDIFYKISWESTKIIKSGLDGNDFVSGYSMTNKYEDFAESFTYYVLHNGDFLKKTQKSNVLLKKYNFFKNILFDDNDNFVNTDFSENNKIKNYYRDITKIEFSTKNFLQYLKKSI